jgi:hypothetical protein
VREQKSKHKRRPAQSERVALHPTFAEKVPYFSTSSRRVPKTSVVPAAAPVLAAAGSHGPPIVLILVFLLGSASLVVAALKDVSPQKMSSAVAILSDHSGELMYITIALLLGIGIGLVAAFGLQ